MDIRNLERDGFLVPISKMSPNTVDILKSILLDAVIATIGGSHSLPENEKEKILSIVRDEPRLYRPMWPVGMETSLEMAGFLNGYCIRYADWCDTQRQEAGRGGHPADMCATVLALCDSPTVEGARVLEAINLGYKMWSFFHHHIFYRIKGFDDVSILSFTVPLLASVCLNEPPDEMQNALRLSAMGGMLLMARAAPVTNMKCGASGYSIARALWCWRMSKLLQGPESVFAGKNSWYSAYAEMDAPLTAPDDDEVYSHIQLKTVPCCNVNQAPVECALRLHERLGGDTGTICRIEIRICASDAAIGIQPEQPQYPYDHPTADHHLRYCAMAALQYGDAAPEHLFSPERMENESVRRLIDVTEVGVMGDDEIAEMGGENGACKFKAFLRGGSVLEENTSRPAGLFSGMTAEERAARFREVVRRKQKMVENAYDCDLSGVEEVIYHIEKYSGKELLDAVFSARIKEQQSVSSNKLMNKENRDGRRSRKI